MEKQQPNVKEKPKKERMYSSLGERIKTEWIIYLLAFVFILIADSIGQVRFPVWKGTFIIFPIFFSLALGLLTGPNVLKILDNKKVKAAGSLVGIAILPFIAKLGINAGAQIETVLKVARLQSTLKLLMCWSVSPYL